MIFVCLGSQTFAFDRLLIELDKLVFSNKIKDKIFVQAGTVRYIPKKLQYKQFLSHDEFEEKLKSASLIIAHGGTGALIGALKLGKNVIGVPRLAKYKEHVDDHQLQIVRVLEEQGYIRAVYDIGDLEAVINKSLKNPINKIYNRESYIVEIIEKYIDSHV